MKGSISLHWVTVISLLYLAVPCMLFFSSWFAPWVAWPVNLGIIWSIVSFTRTKEEDLTWQPGVRNGIIIGVAGFASILIFLVSGIAGYISPAPDVLIFREALYNNLIREAWPVVLPDGKEMSYYLAGMLPPALVSRIFDDYTTQRLIAVIWYALGIWLTLLLFYCRNRHASLLFLILMIIFKDPTYIIINSFAGNGEIWGLLTKILNLSIENTYVGARHPVEMLLINAQGCNFQPFSLLCAAILINCREQPARLIPLSIALILPSSPLGAIACMPIAAYNWLKTNSIFNRHRLISLVIPTLIALFCAIYYGRADSATCFGFYGSLLNNWSYFLFNYYSAILLSAILFTWVLWPVIKQDTSLKICLFCIIITPWIFYGSSPDSGMFGQNELWLKASVVYHMHLIAALCFNWSKLPAIKYLYLVSLAILASRDERIKDISYTGKAKVTDVWGGHLHHPHVSIYQKVPDCKAPLIPGCMLHKGEAEQTYPCSILPKAKGCDYTPAMQPDGRIIRY